ncbi:hypothetical protein CRENBAI_017616 [Crenichthys baileyi]|uniref:Uncharacterized protein n=1 Tax=Crenichthys baileyi TaxID=28760 RepID=A0AAV9S458_9TELE
MAQSRHNAAVFNLVASVFVVKWHCLVQGGAGVKHATHIKRLQSLTRSVAGFTPDPGNLCCMSSPSLHPFPDSLLLKKRPLVPQKTFKTNVMVPKLDVMLPNWNNVDHSFQVMGQSLIQAEGQS